MNGWISKPWGWTLCLYADDRFELWTAHVLAGGYSSLHHHDLKANRISCRDATLAVWVNDVATIVNPGQHIDIPAGVPHRFEVLESGRIWETYTGQCHPQDIVRRDTNGWKPPRRFVA